MKFSDLRLAYKGTMAIPLNGEWSDTYVQEHTQFTGDFKSPKKRAEIFKYPRNYNITVKLAGYNHEYYITECTHEKTTLISAYELSQLIKQYAHEAIEEIGIHNIDLNKSYAIIILE